MMHKVIYIYHYYIYFLEFSRYAICNLLKLFLADKTSRRQDLAM